MRPTRDEQGRSRGDAFEAASVKIQAASRKFMRFLWPFMAGTAVLMIAVLVRESLAGRFDRTLAWMTTLLTAMTVVEAARLSRPLPRVRPSVPGPTSVGGGR